MVQKDGQNQIYYNTDDTADYLFIFITNIINSFNVFESVTVIDEAETFKFHNHTGSSDLYKVYRI